MNWSLAHTITVNLDVLLSIAVCATFSRPSLRKHYPWMFSYLSVRAVTAVIVEFLLYGPLLASEMTYTKIYFVVYWTSCLISAALIFLSCLDVYREAMSPLPGLARMGTTVFAWAAIASVVVTATTLTSLTPGSETVAKIGLQLLRCAGATELCLLALLLLSMRAIGLSLRSRPMGMALGLGLMAAIDCAESIVSMLGVNATPAIQLAFEVSSVITLGVWSVYSAMPEPARRAVTVPVNSAIYKWDQIASALGHKGTQVAVQPAPSFFLVDVEKVVERAFVRTLKGKESES
ncbi:hypothetical protein [Acidicapsa acidisoli]|uniref:hypothetical protein n=1 Tax=Acidicapsa acidisoli TaxID=1615681 RepID=UPI0021DFCAEE|nr:hypothetical protein [Acidicapsa acidisoli]